MARKQPGESQKDERDVSLLAIGAALADAELAKTLELPGEFSELGNSIRRLADGTAHGTQDAVRLEQFLQGVGVQREAGKTARMVVERARVWKTYRKALAWGKRTFSFFLCPVGTIEQVIEYLRTIGFEKGESDGRPRKELPEQRRPVSE